MEEKELTKPEDLFETKVRRGEMLGNAKFINAVSKHLNALSKSQYWPDEKMRELQTKRLRNLTTRVSHRSAFWQKHFSKNNFDPLNAQVIDIKSLPILRRSDLLYIGKDIHLEPLESELPIFKRTSSGTTGISFELVYSEHEMLINYTVLIFRHPFFENEPVERILSRKPFVVLGNPGFRYVFGVDFFHKTFENLHSIDLDNKVVRQKIYDAINEASPAILVGYASLIAKLAEYAIEDNINLNMLAVRTSSEPASEIEKDKIRSVFNTTLINMFTGNGTGVIGFECESNPERFHVNSEHIILEVVDGNGKTLPDGEEGELVATSLDFTLTPIIRYAHNDIGRLIPEECPCGRTLPLFEFKGRRGYDLKLPSGNTMRMMHLHEVFVKTSLGKKTKQIQIIQTGTNSIRLLIVPKTIFTLEDEISIRIAFMDLLGNEKMDIEIKYVDSVIPGRSHKPSLFVTLEEARERNLI